MFVIISPTRTWTTLTSEDCLAEFTAATTTAGSSLVSTELTTRARMWAHTTGRANPLAAALAGLLGRPFYEQRGPACIAGDRDGQAVGLDPVQLAAFNSLLRVVSSQPGAVWRHQQAAHLLAALAPSR